MADHRLTIADQVMVNALANLLLYPRPGAEDEQMMRAVLRDVLPDVSRSHPYIAPLAEVADDLLEPGPHVSQFHAAGRLSDFFKWRAGEAYAAFRQARKGAA